MFIIIKRPSRSEARMVARIVSEQTANTITTREVLQQGFQAALNENGKVIGAVNSNHCYSSSRQVRKEIRAVINTV